MGNSLGCTATASARINYQQSCGDVYFPSAISPNGNGVNDRFGALGNLANVSNYILAVYNRYGELVFKTNNPYQKWDAFYKLKAFGNFGFVWYASYKLNGVQKNKKGSVLVIK